MLRSNGGDDLRLHSAFRPINRYRDLESSRACERVPIKPRRGRERRQRRAIVAAVVVDVGARDLQEGVDGRLGGAPFGREIVL